ncbi:MAG: TonB-dependent receptor, partial [Pseudomonadota bacterium]
QVAEASEVILLDQILVEGELLTRTLQDSQTSVAVITGEELEQRSDPDLYTVFERTPGVTADRNGLGVSIRGISELSAGGDFGNSALLSYNIDGATTSNFLFLRSNGPDSVWDLEQIEILRGPQSTQTGRNALGGAIIVRSKDPSDELEFKARGDVGNFATLGGAFAANVPIEDTGVALRFSGDLQRSDGFIENISTGDEDAGEYEKVTLRGGLKIEPTDDFSAVLKYTYFYNRDGAETINETVSPNDRVALSGDEESERTLFNSVNLRMAYDLSDEFVLESETTYFWSDFLQLGDTDGTAADLGTFERDRRYNSFEQELRLTYDTDRIRATIGGFYTSFDEDSETAGNTPASALVPFAPPTAVITFRTDNVTEVENYAIFGEAEFDILPELTLLGGFRYDRESATTGGGFTGTVNDPSLLPFLPPITPPSFLDASYSAFLPKAGVVYRFTDDHSLGFTVQRGYRGGGATRRALGEINEFDPEFTWNFELAARTQWLDNRLTANANAFYTLWTDQQVNVEGAIPVIDRFTDNAGRSRLFGGEVDLVAAVTENLDLFASTAYANTRFIDFTTDGNVFDGNEFPGAPKWTASVGGTYTFNEGWFFSADASYTSSAFGDAANTPENKSDERFLVNARAGYQAENFEVFAYARNLFDVDYATGRFEGGAGTIARIGEPLVFGVIGQIRL